MTRSPGWTRRSFLIAAGGAAGAAAAGVVLGRSCVAPSGRPAAARVSDLAGAGRFDVCIVGSGPAGAVLGTDLVERGLRTVILESGQDLRAETLDRRIVGLETYRSSGPVAYPVAASRVRGVGGTSIRWTGNCSRFLAIDFEPNAYTPPGAPWPLRYRDLEPWYERAEDTLRVRSFLANYRRTLTAKLDEVGVRVTDSPRSRSSPVGGPVRAANHLLPAFTDSPRALLVSGATVTHLDGDARGRVRAAEVRALDGNAAAVEADTFVVACGGIESARLLLLSRSPARPDGLGNEHGLVGRNFMEHPNVLVRGRVGWRGPVNEVGRSYRFYEPFKRAGLGAVILAFVKPRQKTSRLQIALSFEMEPRGENRVVLAPDFADAFGNPGAALVLSFSDRDERTRDRALAVVRDVFARLRARDVEAKPMSWSHHHMGTCRMGTDPRTSVVDANLRLHGSPNVYVLGSSTFVTGGAAHPTPLIVALGHRLADHLADRVERRAA